MGEKMESVADFIFLGSKITADGEWRHEVKRHLLLGRKAITNLQHNKKQRHHFADKGPYSQSCGFFSSHIGMWELDHKEGWVPMNWCFWTVVLEKTFESPLDCKEIKPVNPKGNQPWIFIGRTDAEAAAPILWPPMWRADPLEKTLMLGKIEGRRRGQQRMRWLDGITSSNGHEFEQTLGDGEGQGGLACCSPWGLKESDTTEWLNSKRRVWPLEWPAWCEALFVWALQLLDNL